LKDINNIYKLKDTDKDRFNDLITKYNDMDKYKDMRNRLIDNTIDN